MPRSTRARLGADAESAMTPAPRRLDRTVTSAPPLVQRRPLEEQLASHPGLLGRNRPLGGEPPDAPTTDPEVLRGAIAVEPLVIAVAPRCCQLRSDAIHHEVDQLLHE